MRLLLDRGADVNAVSRHPIGATPLIGALFGRKVEAARMLIDAGADVHRSRGGTGWPRAGWTPLHYAAAFGYLDLIESLMAKGASPEALDESGASPLDAAREAGQQQALRLLNERSPE
jgi:ankyrin repeat protein